jgi:hypothetical protein
MNRVGFEKFSTMKHAVAVLLLPTVQRAIKNCFRDRSAEQARAIVEEWTVGKHV